MTSKLKVGKPKILLLCGPKGCGKNRLLRYYNEVYTDTYCDYLMADQSGPYPWFDASCKVHLYKLVQDFFLVSKQRFWEIYNDRELKEKPMPEFKVQLSTYEFFLLQEITKSILQGYEERVFGFVEVQLSIRQAMIYLSEVVIKPRLGMNYFSKSRMELIKQNLSQLYYDDSSSCFNGDSSELDGLVEHFGEDNILLIRIKGRGTFDGDSRSYHPDGVVKHTVDLWNDKDEQSFLVAGSKIIEEFLDRS